MLVAVAGDGSFDTFMRSLEAAWNVPLDELELILYIKNASARKYDDEHPTKS